MKTVLNPLQSLRLLESCSAGLQILEDVLREVHAPSDFFNYVHTSREYADLAKAYLSACVRFASSDKES